MAYTKTNWLARTGTGLNKYKDTNDNNRILALVHSPDSITQQGTPLSAENLNKMEQGIYDAHVTADGAVQKSGGELKDTVTTFSEATGTRSNIASGEKTSNIFGKIKQWFSALKALAFKDKVAAGDYTAGSIVNADISSSAAIAQSKISGLTTDLGNKAPSTHTHGNITTDGKVGTVADKLLCTGAGGAVDAKTVADLKALFLDITHPVGSIFMSATLSTTSAVATALGGTWVAWGAGRVPVGVDTSDTDFDTAEETGGQKDAVIPSHTHSYNAPPSTTDGHKLLTGELPSHNHTIGSGYPNPGVWAKSNYVQENYNVPSASGNGNTIGVTSTDYTGSGNAHSHGITAVSGTTGSTGDASTANKNLQPYITCYMYKRTA